MRARCRRSIAALPLVALVACLGNEASAQVITNITSDGTLGTIVAPSAIPNQVDIKGGTVTTGAAGNNLFHSFGQFDLGTGWTAAWASPGVTIANVVNRVTGGTASNLYGKIDTTALPAANFYFINPAGIVFGSGFSLNVPAAAHDNYTTTPVGVHFSTANEIVFQNGDTFTISTPDGSNLSVSSPAAFGFIASRGDIKFQGTPNDASHVLSLDTSAGLDLSAANIKIDNSTLTATGGITLSAVGAQNLVLSLVPSANNVAAMKSGTGQVSITNSKLMVPLLTDASGRAMGYYGGKDLTIDAGSISISTPNPALQRSFISTDFWGGNFNNGGSIYFNSGSLTVDRSTVSAVPELSDDSSGSINADVDSFDIRNGSTFLTAQNGTINLTAVHSGKVNDSTLDGTPTSAFVQTAGSISLKVISGLLDIYKGTISTSNSAPDSFAGTIQLTGQAVKIDRSTLSTSQNGPFVLASLPTGSIKILATGVGADPNLAGVSISGASTIEATTGTGAAGLISVDAGGGNLSVVGNSKLNTTATNAAGTAGEIKLAGASISINSGATLSTDGTLGNITLTSANDITIFGGSTLTAVSNGPGKAGTISINADGVVDITGRGKNPDGTIPQFTVTSSALGPTGDAGNVQVTGAAVILDGASLRSNAEPATQPQSLSDRTERGLAGTITVTSTNGDIQVLNGSNINANGREGSVEIKSAGNFIQKDSDLTASSFNVLGDAGGVSVTAKNITIGGGLNFQDTVHTSSFTGVGGTINLNATGDLVLLPKADLEAIVFGDKKGGDININVGGAFQAVGGASEEDRVTLAASNFGTGAAGSVIVKAASILFTGSSFIRSTATTAPGARAGTIDLTSTANDISLAGSTLDTNGAGGDIRLASARDVAIGASSLSSVSQTSDKAGTISVSGAGIVNVDGGTLTSSNNTGGTAGEIALNSTGSNLLLTGAILKTDGALGNITLTSAGDTTIGGSTLTSESSTSAAAGTISITANGAGVVDVTGTSGTKTISSSNSGTGNAGSVAIKGAAVRLHNADVESTATTAQNAQAGKIEVTSTKSEILLAGSTLKTDGKLGDITLASARDVTIGSSSLTSESSSAEAAGTITITAPQAINITGISGTKTISSSNTGTGNAGSIAIGTLGAPTVDIAGATITSEGYNPETKTGRGAAGSLVVQGSKVTIHNNSVLSTNTFKAAIAAAGALTPSSVSSNSGLVKVTSSGALTIDTSKLTSNTYGAADAGNVEVTGTSVTLGNAALTSDTYASGNAGDVLVFAGTLTIGNDTLLSSQALPGSTGRGGIVSISAGPLSLDNSIISTASANPNAAGSITLNVASLLLNNGASVISSNTSSTGGGNNSSAGAISIVSKGPVTLAGGSSIQTNSIAGPAGDITFDMPNTAVLLLAGFDAPSSIQTNSTSATGGEITISDPFAIVLNGGNIQALGPGGGAKVHITTTALIPSSDRPNAIEVNGSFVLETQADNVSNSLSTRDLNVLDASRVLRGQCLARRAEGDISQLTYRPLGPYAVRPALPRGQQPNGGIPGPIGGCM